MPPADPVIIVSIIPEGSPSTRLELSDQIVGFEYEDCEAKADRLRLRVDNYDLRNFDDPIWRKGNLVDVTWGYTGAMAPTRRCRIQKVTGFLELNVEAYGLEVVLNSESKVRTFENVSRSEVARRIAKQWGYNSPETVHIEDTRVVRDTVSQGALTDAQFLRKLAQKEGFQWWIDFDGFHFHQRNLTQDVLRVLEWRDSDSGTPKEIIAINVENDITAKPGTVVVKSRDPVQRRTIEVAASHETETARQVLAAVQEIPGTDSKPVPGFAGVAQKSIATGSETSEEAAKRVAAGKFRTAQQVAVKITLEMVGDPNMLAKSVVELRGVGKRLSQRYYVRTVKHTIRGGYTCRLEMVSDGSGGHSTKSRLAKGSSRINVGPGTKGKRGKPAGQVERRTIALTPELLKRLSGKDPDGQDRVKFADGRHREPPSTDSKPK